MKMFPSCLSAALAGSVGFPLFMLGLKYLQQHDQNKVLLFFWSLIFFLLPLFFSTFDFRYFSNIYKHEGSIFRSCVRNRDLNFFVYPAIKRILFYFVFAVVSTVSIQLFGIRSF